MKDLLLVVPSRGRPGNIARLWEAMQATCQGDTTLLVGLDADDPTAQSYPQGPVYRARAGLRQVVVWINELTMPLMGGSSPVSDYRYIGHIGDDNVPRTKGWDVRVMEALELTPFAFGNDLYPYRPPGALCCHVFCRSEVIRALGYLGPPSLRHMYVDDVWMAWGQAAGITFLQDVIIEHLHYSAGKSEPDDNYRESAVYFGADSAAYTAYCNDPAGLGADIRKLLDLKAGAGVTHLDDSDRHSGAAQREAERFDGEAAPAG